MLSFSRFFGDGVMGTLSADGKIEVLEHLIGVFSSRYEQTGHFLVGEIRIRFDGQDPLAAQSLGEPDLWRALAFRGDITLNWEDIPTSEEDPFDRAVTLSYKVRVSGDRTDFDDLNTEVRCDLEAVDRFLDSLVARSLQKQRATLSPTAA